MKEPEIFTDIPGKPGRFGGDHTTFVGPANPPRWLVRLAGDRWAYNLKGRWPPCGCSPGGAAATALSPTAAPAACCWHTCRCSSPGAVNRT